MLHVRFPLRLVSPELRLCIADMRRGRRGNRPRACSRDERHGYLWNARRTPRRLQLGVCTGPCTCAREGPFPGGAPPSRRTSGRGRTAVACRSIRSRRGRAFDDRAIEDTLTCATELDMSKHNYVYEQVEPCLACQK